MDFYSERKKKPLLFFLFFFATNKITEKGTAYTLVVTVYPVFIAPFVFIRPHSRTQQTLIPLHNKQPCIHYKHFMVLKL